MGALTPIAQVLSEHVDRQNALKDVEAEARLRAKQAEEARKADAAEAAAAVEKAQAAQAEQNKINSQRAHFNGLTSPVQQALMQAGVDPNQPNYFDKIAAATAPTSNGQPQTADTGLVRNFDINVAAAPPQPVKSPIAESLSSAARNITTGVKFDPATENKFQQWIRGSQWFKDYVSKYHEEPDLNDPENYDYRKAYSLGISPKWEADHGEYRWSDIAKGPNNPHGGEGGQGGYTDTDANGRPMQVNSPKSPIAESLAGTVRMPQGQLSNIETAKQTQGITLETADEARQRRLASDSEEKASANARKLVSADIATFKSKDFMDNIMNSPGLKKGYLDAHNANRVAAGMEPLSMPDFDQLVLGPQAQATVTEKKAHTQAILAEIDNDKKQLELNYKKFQEDQRHNKAGESIGKARVGIAAQNANTSAGRAATYAGYLDFAKSKAKQDGPMTGAEASAALSKYATAKQKVDDGYDSYRGVMLYNGERLKAAGVNPDTGGAIKKPMVGKVDPWRNLANVANELPDGALKQKITVIMNTKPKGVNPTTIYNDLMKRLGR